MDEHVPEDDPRQELATSLMVLVLVRNVLMAREPLDGVPEWAARFPIARTSYPVLQPIHGLSAGTFGPSQHRVLLRLLSEELTPPGLRATTAPPGH